MRAIRMLLKKAQDLYSPPESVFLKQYGEMRTGTNFIRAALLSNYTNAVPLMHVLGDKHSPPVDLRACLDRARHLPDPALEFVRGATLEAPAKTTRAQDVLQLEYLKTIAPALTTAARAGRLGFLISLKHPRPWVVSMVNFLGWKKQVKGLWDTGMNPEFAPQLESACKGYNRRHEAWLAFHRSHEARSLLVHHERVLIRPEEVMTEIADKFDLRPRHRRLKFPEEKIGAAYWDHQLPELTHPFDADYYRDKRYEEVLGPELWAVVDRTIDWDLMAGFGYGKVP